MKLDPSDHDAIEEIVEKTVKRVFFDLNIDVSSPEKVIEFRNTMNDVAEWRRAMRTVKSAGLTAAIGTLIAGILAALWLGIQSLIHRGGA